MNTLPDSEIEALALKHEYSGQRGMIGSSVITVHGFAPEGLRTFVAAVITRFKEIEDAQPKSLCKGAECGSCCGGGACHRHPAYEVMGATL